MSLSFKPGEGFFSNLQNMRFSALKLALDALSGQSISAPHWRKAHPKAVNDIVIVGGHGLATADL